MLKKQNDTHRVYERLFKSLSFNHETRLLRRVGSGWTISNNVLRIIYIILCDLITVSIALRKVRDSQIFISEYSDRVYYIIRHFIPKKYHKKILLNINHNMEWIIENQTKARRLSQIFKIVMIEPAANTLIYDFVTPLYLKTKKKVKPPKGNIYLFSPRRAEQSYEISDSILANIKKIYNIIEVGGKTGKFISDKNFAEIFKNGNPILLNYGGNYGARHSGLLLEAIVNQNIIFVPNNQYFTSVAKRQKNVICYTDRNIEEYLEEICYDLKR